MKSFLERACSLAAWFTLMAILGFAVSLLTGCGGDDSPDTSPCDFVGPTATPRDCPVVADALKTTMPVVCAAEGCAK